MQFTLGDVGLGGQELQRHLKAAGSDGAPDLAEAAPADKALQPIPGDGLGAFGGSHRRGVHRLPRRGLRWWEKDIEVGANTAYLPPPVADHGQQLRARPAYLFRRFVRVVESVEELLDSRIVGHVATSPPASVGSGSARSFLARVKVAERGSKSLQTVAQLSVDRHRRYPKRASRFRLRHYMNPQQVGHLALPLWQAIDGRQNTAAVWAEARIAARRGGQLQ